MLDKPERDRQKSLPPPKYWLKETPLTFVRVEESVPSLPKKFVKLALNFNRLPRVLKFLFLLFRRVYFQFACKFLQVPNGLQYLQDKFA